MGRMLDMFGRLVRGAIEPMRLRSRVISVSVRDRDSVSSILADVTPARLVSIFNAADNGDVSEQIQLAQDLVERDGHLATVNEIRRLAAGAVEFIVEPGDESPEAKKAAEAFERELELLDMRTLCTRMMSAVLEQWHIEEVIWDTDGRLNGRSYWRPVRCEEVDARKLIWPYVATTEPGDITAAIPQVMHNWTATDTEPIEPGKFLVHSHRAMWGRPGRGALIRAAAPYYLFKRFSFIDLAAMLVQWGRPWPVIKYDPHATSEQISTWLEQLAASMASRVMAVPAGSEIEVKPASATGADTPHINMIELCNRGLSKLVVGSTTITDPAPNNEAVSSPTHANVRLDIRNADAWAIAAAVRASLAVPYTAWNFGLNVAPPKIHPNLAPKPDPQSRSQVFLAAQTLGLEVESEQIYSDLALNKPDSVPEIIKLEPAAAAGGGVNPLAGLFGHRATAHRAPRGSVAPGGESLAEDAALASWSDQATAAAGKIGDEKFARVATFVDQVERQGGRLADVRARLDELLTDGPMVEDEIELNRDASLAAMLRGRYAVAEAAPAKSGARSEKGREG